MVTRIDLKNLRVSRDGGDILGPITMCIDSPGITTVMGPNGAGKTTLMRAIHGLDRAKGQITCSADRAEQAFVFQTPMMLRRSVLNNLAFPLRLRGVSASDARNQAADMAEKLQLGSQLDQDATSLSGGEAQKLAIGRALICKPKVMFVDEPCANLDPAATLQVEQLLRKAPDNGVMILLATHAQDQAKRLSDEVIMMNQGQIIEHAPAETFFDDPKTPQARAYLNGEIVI